jgi:glycosyltransferase involved in cell wall biosynthesis
MEAQATGLACLSTGISAIPELITDGETGRLIDPDDIPALTAALKALIEDPSERQRLGLAGAAHVRREFAFAPGLDRLSEKFGLPAPAMRLPA